MSYRLASHVAWVAPHVYPGMKSAGVSFLQAFAETIYEYANAAPGRGTRAATLGDIHPTRLATTAGRDQLCRMMPGFWEPASEAHPGGRPRKGAYNRGAEEARLWGALRTRYRPGYAVPTHVLIPPVQAAVARAQAIRDVVEHLRTHEVGVITWDGVDVDGARVTGHVTPTSPDEAVDALTRKVDIEYAGQIKAGDHYPTWRPTGFEFAKALRAQAASLTGHEVARAPAPAVRFEHAHVVLTDELLELLPALRPLRLDESHADEDGDLEAVDDFLMQAVDDDSGGTAHHASQANPPRRRGVPEPAPLVFDDAALALLRSA